MLALVTYPYRDCGNARSPPRCRREGFGAELALRGNSGAGGYVDVPAEKPAEPAAPTAEQEAAPQPVDPTADMTAAELRAVIESKGGFAPRKATKSELQTMLAAL